MTKKNSAVMAAVHKAGEEKWCTLVEHGIGYKVGSSVAFIDSLQRRARGRITKGEHDVDYTHIHR